MYVFMCAAVSLCIHFGIIRFLLDFSPPVVNAEPCAVPALGNLQM